MSKAYFAHPTAEIGGNATIGKDCKIWQYCIVMDGAVLGERVKLGHNVLVEPGVQVGDGCTIKDNISLFSGVKIASDVFVGPAAVFTNVRAPRAFISGKDRFEETHLGRGCTIGAGATIVCGNRIGAYAFVAAGAVVTRDVADYALVAGTPARRIGWVGREGVKLTAELVCPRTGEKYELRADGNGLQPARI
jgi:UDP-2-acetamido-3-amino-2,3-dideoxy-glucuronate N-acetyltransferase